MKNAIMPISIQNAEHYSWGQSCDGWHLLKAESLSVIQERMPPLSAEQLHLHRQAQQIFYILSGTATFLIDGKTHVVKANESVHIPNGIAHQIRNDGEENLCFLVISEPKSHGDRINL